MEEKNVGYLLLLSGLIIMFLAAGFVIVIFIGKVAPVSVVSIPSPTFNTASLMPQVPGIPKPEGQNIQLIPTDSFNKLINMGINIFFMGFILSFGFKVADLGVKLIRPIKITQKV